MRREPQEQPEWDDELVWEEKPKRNEKPKRQEKRKRGQASPQLRHAFFKFLTVPIGICALAILLAGFSSIDQPIIKAISNLIGAILFATNARIYSQYDNEKLAYCFNLLAIMNIVFAIVWAMTLLT